MCVESIGDAMRLTSCPLICWVLLAFMLMHACRHIVGPVANAESELLEFSYLTVGNIKAAVYAIKT